MERAIECGLPATASGVEIGDGLGAPRMSPTPRSAKYGATHGCHRLPGWRKCPPLGIVSASAQGQGQALRTCYCYFFVTYSANRLNSLIGDSIFCRDRRLGRARRVHGGEWGLVGNVGFFALLS